jgi:hypothetical protein
MLGFAKQGYEHWRYQANLQTYRMAMDFCETLKKISQSAEDEKEFCKNLGLPENPDKKTIIDYWKQYLPFDYFNVIDDDGQLFDFQKIVFFWTYLDEVAQTFVDAGKFWTSGKIDFNEFENRVKEKLNIDDEDLQQWGWDSSKSLSENIDNMKDHVVVQANFEKWVIQQKRTFKGMILNKDPNKDIGITEDNGEVLKWEWDGKANWLPYDRVTKVYGDNLVDFKNFCAEKKIKDTTKLESYSDTGVYTGIPDGGKETSYLYCKNTKTFIASNEWKKETCGM